LDADRQIGEQDGNVRDKLAYAPLDRASAIGRRTVGLREDDRVGSRETLLGSRREVAQQIDGDQMQIGRDPRSRGAAPVPHDDVHVPARCRDQTLRV
jgi:hypothetical protein